MSTLVVLDDEDLSWITNVLDVVEDTLGFPWRIAFDRLEREPVRSKLMSAVTGAILQLIGGKARNAPLARQARGLVLGAPALDSDTRAARIDAAARMLDVTAHDIEQMLWADLPRERPVELPAGRPSELEVAALANVQLIQRAVRQAHRVTLSVWGDASRLVRGVGARSLLATITTVDNEHFGDAGIERAASSGTAACDTHPGAGPRTVVDIIGPLALFKRTSVYGRALASLVPLLAHHDAWQLELEAQTREGQPYSSVISSPVLLPKPRQAPADFSLVGKLAGDLEQLAPQLHITRDPPAIPCGNQLVCPELVIEGRYLEVIGFWTAAYLAAKIDRYRAVGIEDPIFCVDESRACTDDELPSGACIVPYKRRIRATKILEALAASCGRIKVG